MTSERGLWEARRRFRVEYPTPYATDRHNDCQATVEQ